MNVAVPSSTVFAQNVKPPTARQFVVSNGDGTCQVGGKFVPCDAQFSVDHAGQKLLKELDNLDSVDITQKTAAIEEQFSDLCRSNRQLIDGRWTSQVFSIKVGHSFAVWKNWDSYFRFVREWRKLAPQSEALAVVESMLWRAFAWDARGTGFANTVSDSNWRLFRERTQRALDSLQKFGGNRSSCDLWYAEKLNAFRGMGESLADIRAVFVEGIGRYPKSLAIYGAMGLAVSPKWQGSLELFDEFARQAAKRSADFEGAGMYARLYWTIDDESLKLENSSYPDWSLLRRGFEDLLKRYPDSWWNANKFASFACRARDKDAYLLAMEKVGMALNYAAWTASRPEFCDLRMLK
ncbi:MAG TPA: hypothetical protein PKN64_14590 [Casimicrobium sp.]|nr:hypothetical protein [Casimicrobium sp.]